MRSSTRRPNSKRENHRATRSGLARVTASLLIFWLGLLEPLAALASARGAGDPLARRQGTVEHRPLSPSDMRLETAETPVASHPAASPRMALPLALPPSLVSVQATSPGAVQGSPAALVDGTLEGIRSLDGIPARLIYDFGEERAIEQLTASGQGQLRLWRVHAPSDELASVAHAPIGLDGSLTRVVLEQPFTARRVVVEWLPASDAPLAELWFWGSSVERGPARFHEREALRLAAGSLPGAQRFAAAAPASADADGAAPRRFELVLPASLEAFASAYLTYALAGGAHWTELRRAVNGRWSPAAAPAREPLQGRGGTSARQVEPLPLAALVPGRNWIELGAASVEQRLQVTDVALVLVPHAGVREAPVPEGRARRQLLLAPGTHAVELIVDVLRSGDGELLVGADGSTAPLLRVPLGGQGTGVRRIDLGELAQRPVDELWFEREPLTDAAGLAARAVLGRAFVRVQPLAAATAAAPVLEISHPLQGECTGAGSEVRGFVTQGRLVAVRGSRGERAELGSDGSFRLVSRERAGRAGGRRSDHSRRAVEVRATLQTGETLTAHVGVDPCERPRAGQVPDWGAPYSMHLRADSGGVLEFGGARLEVPPGALAADTRLSIRPLEQPALAPLEGDKTNVTPESGGFRFGPHGLRFRKPVLLTLPYDAASLGPDAREREVFAFYFDEAARRWERIARLDEARDQRLRSVTDHFTDFVTATIPTPDAPGPRSFDPNAMKGIGLASPMAGIPLMEPPRVSAFGAAQLTHPIELPPGRNGIQPALAFTYSSERGNGWLGVGWDLPISAIEIDTRFGVPRYTEDESLTYLLDGEQLVPATEAFLRERPFLRSPSARVRSGEVVQFMRRVEGRFERIERVGAQAPYHWVITSKQGVQLIYGETGGARLSDPNESADPDARRRVFRWQLERIVDTFGNEARFSYRRDEGCLALLDEPAPAPCAENFTSLYPLAITYTHHPESLAGYRVSFELGDQPRLDRVLSARPGFVEATRQRLAGVRVEYRTSVDQPFAPIRRYAVEYELGDFDKSLVRSLSLQGPRDIPADPLVAQNELLAPPHFVQHRFEYHQTRQLDANGSARYDIFAEPASLPAPRAPYQPVPWGQGLGRSTRLTRLDTESSGQGASLSVSLFGLFSVGGGAGRSSGSDTVRQTLLDLDGDGLPDLLNDAGESAQGALIQPAVEPALFFSGVDLDSARTGAFARRELAALGRGSLGQTRRRGRSVEGNLSVLGGVVGASAGFSRTTAEDHSITADFDGDGFADLVRVEAGRVLVRLADRRGGFAPTPIEWGTLDAADIAATQTELSESAADAAHLVNPLVRWSAPFAGEVEVSAPLAKLRPGGDGLSAAIYLRRAGVASAIWRRVLSPEDLSVCVPSGASECGSPLRLGVEAGDELYFELSGSPGVEAAQLDQDGVADEVSWLPQITYVTSGGSADDVEPYGRPTHVFSLADDFRVAGLPARAWVASAPGRLNLSGSIEKLRTGDDVSARVVHRDDTGALLATYAATLPAEESGDFPPPLSSLDVQAGEILSFELVTDSPIDPDRVFWTPRIRYETYGRIDPETGSYVIGAVSCADEQCTTANDPTPELPLPVELIERDSLAAVSTFDFLPALATQSFRASAERDVDVTVDFGNLGVNPATRASAVLVLQGIEQLIAKAHPDPLTGLARVAARVPAGGPYFATAIVPSGAGPAFIVSANVPVNVRALDPASHPADGQPQDPFSGGFHRWHFGDFNGALALEREPLRFPALNPIEAGAPYFFATPAGLVDDELGLDELGWEVRGGGFIGRESWRPSRVGGPLALRAQPLSALRLGETWNADFSADVLAVDAGFNFGASTSALDLFDLNGDLLPDSVTLDGVRYNRGPRLGFGSREPVPMGVAGKHELRETKHFNARLGLDLGALFGSGGGQFKNDTNTRGDTIQLISTSFRVGQDYGLSATNIDFADINGDGLVDQVQRDGAQNYSVRLGLGYRFSEPIEWLGSRWPSFDLTAGRVLTDVIDELVDLVENNTPDVVKVRDTGTSNVGIGGSAGVPGLVAFQGGGGLSFTQSRTLVDLVDLTGDGLPEAVMKLPDEPFLRVQVNSGSEFGPIEHWPVPDWPDGALDGDGFDALGSGDALDFDRNRASSINAGVSACFLIVCGGVSGYRSTGQGGATLELTDLDGDGLVDHVLKEAGQDSVHAKLNQLGKANLLVRVERPLGGSFDLDYRREGNQAVPEAGIDMPRSQYALAATRVNDGRGESYVETHDYRGGRVDRDERDDYGYASVLTTRLPDGSQIESQFHNQDFFRKGMLARQVEREVSATGPFDLVVQEVDYAAPAASGATAPRTSAFFPKELERRHTRFEAPDPEAQHAVLDGGSKTRRELRDFDAYGDLIELSKSGELDDPTDDLTYTLDHQRAELPYLSLPRSIIARGPDPGAPPLRERRATYDERGALESVTDRIHGGEDARGRLYAGTPATTSYAVDDLGNLFSVVDPLGYTLELGYDEALATFRTSSIDSFYLESRELFDYRFGVPRAVTDVNGHTTRFDYDDYGRMTSARDARAEASRKNTIELVYSQRPGASPLPAWAKTLHRDELRDAAGAERDPIVTVTFADGLGRVIQTKKDLAKDFRDGTPSVVGMAVSGQVRFDVRGRVQLQGQPTFETLSAPSHLPDTSATTFSAAEPLRPVRTDYDVLGRVLAVTLADGSRTTTAHSAGELDGELWFATRVRDAENNERVVYRDVDDSIVAVLERNTFDGAPRTLVTRYAYNPVDELIQVRDAGGNVTSAAYDSLGRRVALDSPDLGLTTTAFDLSGNLIEKQTAELRYQDQAIRYEYDLNRLLEVRYPDTEPVRLEYGSFDQAGDAHGNLAGRLSRELSEAGERRFEYDALGNVVYEAMRFNDAERYEHREPGDEPAPRRDPRDRDDRDDGGAELALGYEYDSFARLLRVDLPTACRERLFYDYDAGGSVRSAYGLDQSRERRCGREPNRTEYLTHIGYDEFEQRTRVVYGNGVETRFDFEPETRRLASLDSQHFVPSRDPRRPRESSGGSWVAFQSLRYGYDDVGNITALDNLAPFDGHDPEDAPVGTTAQRFSYDALYQLTAARGTYRDSASGEHRYELEIAYDPVGNVERKRQLSERWKNQRAPSEPDRALTLDYVLDDQSYLYHYLYEGYQPHAPSAIVEHDPSEEREDGRDRPQPDDRQKKQFLEYDESGNQLYRERSNDFREIDWSSENQIRSVTQDAETISRSLYDGSNTRRVHFQRTSNGAEQTSYLGQYVTVRDAEHVTLHVFAGAVRIASKRERGNAGDSVSPLWFHPDHLGSTQYASDDEQRLVTHAEYFPSGELWIDERSSEFRDAPTFLFNGKELEESTGLLAYGARHYDARQGQWLAPDPILDRYFEGAPNGGVFTPTNLGLYAYGANNPTSYVDTNGEFWGLAIKVGKVIVKGGDIASTIAGAVEDFQTVTDSNAGTLDRVLAAGSLAMEVFAVSPRDVKNVVGMVRGGDRGGAAAEDAGRALRSECNCFAAGTPVMTASGQTAIEQIAIGDWVLAMDPDTGAIAYKQVTDVSVTPGQPLLDVTLPGSFETITATPGHPFWVEGEGWVHAIHLEAGDALLALGVLETHAGAESAPSEPTTGLNRVRAGGSLERGERGTVYNLTVEDFHTFFVGSTGIWVHNASPCATTSDNARELAKNLAREGRNVQRGEAAGHIVPSTGTRGHWAAAARTRELLSRYDIGINDAANGIPIGHPRPHNEMHSRAFLQANESRLYAVEARMLEQGYGHRAIRSALRREIRAIGKEVLR